VRAEIHLDTQELITSIIQGMSRELKPFLNKQRAEEEPLLTVKTLAKYLQVSEQWVYERVHLKEIPHLKVGKFPRFKRSDIDRWLDTLNIPVSNPLSSAIQPQGRGVNRRGA
jgi:excisionase family DNA binding protein